MGKQETWTAEQYQQFIKSGQLNTKGKRTVTTKLMPKMEKILQQSNKPVLDQEEYTVVIPGELTDLNTYINTERTNRFMAAKIKDRETSYCIPYFVEANIPQIASCHLKFKWITKDARKDPDNIAFSQKAIIDSAVKSGILINDGRKQIKTIFHEFDVDKENPRIIVRFIPIK